VNNQALELQSAPVRVRFYIFFAASIIVLISASDAFAGGAYQWTNDWKKALVWNSDPQPGDTASWSGWRDENGYATGPGTLKWSRSIQGFTTGSNIAMPKNRVPISTYSGTMVAGKFNGGVMTVDHGKTYHATFVDGLRKGQWSSGPLITKAESAESAPAREKSQTTEIAKEPATEHGAEKIASEKTTAQRGQEPDIPAEAPTSEEAEKTVPPGTKPQAPESTQLLIVQASSESPDEAATPRTPVTRKAALAPGAVRAFDRPTDFAAKKPEPSRAKSDRIEKATKAAKAAPSQASKSAVSSSDEAPSEEPAAQNKTKDLEPPKLKSEKATTEASKPLARETPVDDSIESLVGPPASLRTTNPAETSSPPQAAAAVAAASPAGGATKLTAVNAMDIADIEARTRGYDLGEYQLPKAEYNAESDTWLVSYAARDAGANTKKLSVTIQDKNGKAEIRR
jgi:hypothetical protein